MLLLSKNLGSSLLNHEPRLFKETPNIPALVNTIRSASLFIGNDSLCAHIANSLSIPSLVFIGSVNPEFRFADAQPDFHIMQNGCEFAGCYHTVIGTAGASCVLEGSQNVKCCTFTKEQVLNKLNLILKNYNV